jgi:hypothetical protein
VSYREAFLFGWSIAWRQSLWSAAAGIPLALATAAIVRLVPADAEFRDVAFGAVFYPAFVALTVLAILPYAVRAAARNRVQAVKSGRVLPLTYADSLQVSTLAVLMSLMFGGIYALLEFPSVRLGPVAEVPLLIFVVYPAVAELAVAAPYRGFRLVVIGTAPKTKGAGSQARAAE